jgi:acetyl esterase/lipase
MSDHEAVAEDEAWRGWPQEILDAAYNNMAAVSDSQARLDGWAARSAALRARQPSELDIPYGDAARQRFDIFRCGEAGAPLLAFIHGGWWQRNSKEIFCCMAEGPLAAGFDVAMIGYTLAPEAGLTRIVHEVRAALDAIVAREAGSGQARRLLLSGWSAGGHLTATVLDHPGVFGGLSISGVFDLAPIRHSYINDKLRLSEAEVGDLSPLRAPPSAKPMLVVYGSSELPELRRQSEAFARGRDGVRLLPLEGHDHFSILEELASPDGAIVRHLVSALRA